ncbi:MAG: hypothetical protein PHU56_04370 [Candidatus Pacebacteria bacterium]|nr:hypothetical protein [Candidatus Paceibacterota bacterium]
MENRESHFEEIFQTRKNNEEHVSRGDVWIYDYTKRGGPYSYEITFREVIGQPWRDFLREQKEKQGDTAAMDFMGGGTCFSGLGADKKLAVRLKDKFRDPKEKIDVIAGDVLSKKTWREIFSWAEKETDGRGFDLILSRPIGGLMRSITSEADVYYFLIEHLWEVLNKDNGTLYTQLPIFGAGIPHEQNAIEKTVRAWVGMLERAEGLEIKFSENEKSYDFHGAYPVLRLRKTPGSPSQLPKLSAV